MSFSLSFTDHHLSMKWGMSAYFLLQWFPLRIPLTRTTGLPGPTSLRARTSRSLETIWLLPTPVASARLWRRNPATACCWKSIRSAQSPSLWKRKSRFQTATEVVLVCRPEESKDLGHSAVTYLLLQTSEFSNLLNGLSESGVSGCFFQVWEIS